MFKWFFRISPKMLLFWAITVTLIMGSCAFGLTNLAYGHEGHGYKHNKGMSIVVVETDPNDPRCPLTLRWTLEDGKSYCVIFEHDKLHLKELPQI
jgi:hypothetical protein